MVKKVLIILFCIFIMIFSCSCSKKESVSVNSSVKPSDKDEIKGVYLVESNEKNIISIKLPTDYEFDEAQNDFFADFILSKLFNITGEKFKLTRSDTAITNDTQSYSGYYIDIESKTSYISDDIISIVFAGLLNKKRAAHPIHLFFALNFNPQTMCTVDFSSRHIIDDALYNEFAKQGEKEILEKAGGIWPEGWDGFSETLCSKETFFDGLNGKNSEIEWYYTENGIGFSYSVPVALGNHREVEIAW